MNPMLISMAILCGLVLAAVAVTLLALLWARRTAAGTVVPSGPAQAAPVLEQMSRRIEDLSEEMHELRAQPAAPTSMALPRAGMNLNKRSQALRLHRRGDSIEQIAAVLGVPCQEVDLLIKVQRIAMSRM
jgi:hypothetical protein